MLLECKRQVPARRLRWTHDGQMVPSRRGSLAPSPWTRAVVRGRRFRREVREGRGRALLPKRDTTTQGASEHRKSSSPIPKPEVYVSRLAARFPAAGPGAATRDAYRGVSSVPSGPVGRRTRVAIVPTVLDRLPHVAVHVVEAEGVRREGTHGHVVLRLVAAVVVAVRLVDPDLVPQLYFAAIPAAECSPPAILRSACASTRST